MNWARAGSGKVVGWVAKYIAPYLQTENETFSKKTKAFKDAGSGKVVGWVAKYIAPYLQTENETFLKKAFKDGSTKVERTVRVYTKIKLRPNFIFTQH